MLNNFFNNVLVQILGVVLLLAICICLVDHTVNRVETVYAKPVGLVTGEDTSSKFIVERFEGVSISLVTDKLTGCEYVYTQSGSITPRMQPDGTQYCGQSTYSNIVEIDYE